MFILQGEGDHTSFFFFSASVQLFFPLQDLESYAILLRLRTFWSQPEALEASEADAVRCGDAGDASDAVIEIDTTARPRQGVSWHSPKLRAAAAGSHKAVCRIGMIWKRAGIFFSLAWADMGRQEHGNYLDFGQLLVNRCRVVLTDSHGLTFARVHLLLAQQNSMRPTVSLQGLNVLEMSILSPYALPDSKALDTPQWLGNNHIHTHW